MSCLKDVQCVFFPPLQVRHSKLCSTPSTFPPLQTTRACPPHRQLNLTRICAVCFSPPAFSGLVLFCFVLIRWRVSTDDVTSGLTHMHAQKDSGLSGVASLAQRRRGGSDTCQAACSQPTDEHESLLHNLKVTPHFCAGMLSVVHGEQGTLGWGGGKERQRGVEMYPESCSGLPYFCFSFWKKNLRFFF